MMLESISIKGFKCFQHLEITTAPLTVLSGFNASGKSTTLQSILLMAQGLRSSRHARYLPLNGPIVRLGTAGEVVARGSRDPITFGFSSGERKVSWSFGAYAKTAEDGGYEEQPAEGGDRERLELLQRSVDECVIYPPDVRISVPAQDADSLISLIRDVIFLGATRTSETNVQPSPDDAEPVHADVGFEGQYAAWWYVRTVDDEVPAARRHPNDDRVTVRGQVDAWLDDLFPGASANAESLLGTGLSKFQLKMGRSGDWSRPANIGYGLTYVFPLIVALLTARRGQVVIVDSPEAHLHPRAQSRMGQMLAKFASAGVQVLIETHSDHILSGVRLAVRAGILRPPQVAIHFFAGATSAEQTGVISPQIDSAGMLSEWPEGFFDQADSDLTELARA